MDSLLPEDTTRRIAKAVAEAKYEDVPTEHYEILKKSIVDVYGAMIAGCEAAAVPELLALAKNEVAQRRPGLRSMILNALLIMPHTSMR